MDISHTDHLHLTNFCIGAFHSLFLKWLKGCLPHQVSNPDGQLTMALNEYLNQHEMHCKITWRVLEKMQT